MACVTISKRGCHMGILAFAKPAMGKCRKVKDHLAEMASEKSMDSLNKSEDVKISEYPNILWSRYSST